MERQIEEERRKLMEVLSDNESFMVVTVQLKKILKLSEEKKNIKPFYLVDSGESSSRGIHR